MAFLTYSGTKVLWYEGINVEAAFDATSGHGLEFSAKDYQVPSEQCVPFDGPIPEGMYRLDTWINAKVPNYSVVGGVCNLHRQSGVQVVPKEKKSKPMVSGGSCLDLWGPNRVNLYPYDQATRNRCNPRRYGFYIHDSNKGGSSGCIEIGVGFFKKLREWIKKNNPKNKKQQEILLSVAYTEKTTRGNTLRP